jgi:signal peptidase I
MTSASIDAPAASPWLSVWRKPRATITRIAAASPRRHVWLLAALGLIATLVGQLTLSGLTAALLDWRAILGLVLFGTIVGILGLYFSGFFYWLGGKLFGGRALPVAIRAAVAWSELPLVLGAAICLAIVAASHLADSRLDPDVLTGLLSAIVFATALWALILKWLMLGRVQNFGFWRTLASVLVGWLAALLIIAVLFVLPFRTLAFQPFSIPSSSMMPTLRVGDYLFVAKYPYGYTRYSFPFSPPLFSGRVLAAEPDRGDVVVYRSPRDTTVDYISRVVGLPGERIQVTGGHLRINGEPVKRERAQDFNMLRDGRAVAVKRWRETLPNGVTHETLDLQDDGFLDDTPEYRVPAGHYFMMGDNRDNASDSRVLNMVGYIPLGNIVGRAAMIFFSKAPAAETGEPDAPFRRFGIVVR